MPKKDMPKQLCSPSDFRAKICGKAAGYKNLVVPNESERGIPQGAPLSDLLANLYLIDFDIEMKELAAETGGSYMRYSDDILIIVPGGAAGKVELMNHVRTRIGAFGKSLQIKEDKCSIHQFISQPSRLVCESLFPSHKKPTGLTYLGFWFDGEHVYLCDGTLANFWRKVSKILRREAVSLVRRYPGKDLSFLESEFNIERLIQKIGRVREFEEKLDKRSWTFWTYARRADCVFGERSRIHSQLARHRKIIQSRARQRLAKTYYKSLGSE